MLFKSLVLAVDLDSTVVDLLNVWLKLYNDDYGTTVSIADLKTWDIQDHVHIGKEIEKYLETPHLYRDLVAYPGACEALLRMHKKGHEIHIISAASEAEHTAADKIWWCRQYLPFIPRQFITISHQKDRYLCDVLIDDSPSNITRHFKRQPQSFRIGIGFPYNEPESVRSMMDLRAGSYEDPAQAWNEIEEFVERIARGEVKRAA